LRHRRDATLPYMLNRLRLQEALLLQFSETGPDKARMAQKDLARVANARKAYYGQYQGLLDQAVFGRKVREEDAFRARIAADAPRQQTYGPAWERIAEAQRALAPFEREYYLLERGDALDSELFRIARHLLRLAAEKPKPNAERLREYRDSN